MTRLMTPDELEAALRKVGAERYHNLHPFHHLLHGGKLNKGQVQAWALNRYCYQSAIPRKDAALMSRCDDRDLRREWIHRITDHDGTGEDPGGIERWLVLTDGLGLDRDYVVSKRGALPATKFAVEAYVHFTRDKHLGAVLGHKERVGVVDGVARKAAHTQHHGLGAGVVAADHRDVALAKAIHLGGADHGVALATPHVVKNARTAHVAFALDLVATARPDGHGLLHDPGF